MTTTPSPLEHITQHPVSHSCIFLHGLGADGENVLPIVQALALPGMRYLLPTAAHRPVTINGGARMPAWFDVTELSLNALTDTVGIDAAVLYVKRLIQQENARGIPSERIFLAGFSQGGVLALYTALTAQIPLAGVIGLSTFLPFLPKQEKTLTRDIFLAHGTADTLIPITLAEHTQRLLQQANHRVVLHRYHEIEHSVCDAEIIELIRWMKKRVG